METKQITREQKMNDAILAIRKFDCGAWLDLNGSTPLGKQKRIELMNLLDKLYES